MLLGVFAILMTALVAWALVRPLRRPLAAPPAPEAYNLAVYRDQLAELERDLARGAINPEESAAARTEIERRVLAAGGRLSDVVPAERAAPRWAAPVVVAVLLAGAGGAYLVLGNPGAPDRPFATRGDVDQAIQGGDAMHGEMDQLVSQLAKKLQENPEDPTGWALMARSLLRLDRMDEAIDAYRRAIALTKGTDGNLVAEYGEALVIANQGAVVPEARTIFERMLREQPKSPQARYYLGLAKVQSGDTPSGLQDWKALLAESPADAPWRETLERQIATAEGRAPPAPSPSPAPPAGGAPAPGPSQADIAAAGQMSADDRAAMIETMVARLADRLKSNPDDLDGWRRLARAYGVLGRKPEAMQAHQRVLALAPNDPDALWALGAAAQERGDARTARRYWQTLLAGLPAGSQERGRVEAAIASLPK